MADIKPQFELFLSTVLASFAYRLNQGRIRQALQPISVGSKATGRQRIGGVGKAGIRKKVNKAKIYLRGSVVIEGQERKKVFLQSELNTLGAPWAPLSS